MFRNQTNAFDDVVAKATDENLTSENWEFMMDAWEKVNAAGENGPKDAVAALIKRLAHRNANVLLYTLELANGFTQNCGPSMHRELASRAFTDALLRLASDRNTHQAVKSAILEKMAEWTEMFKNDPGLGIMEQSFNRLKSTNPNIHPPSKPTKREITSVDRQKEEEELQLALEISLKEKANAQAQTAGKSPAAPTGQPGPSDSQPASAVAVAAAATPQPAPVTHTTAATVSRVRALYDFVPSETTELAFRKGDIIAVLESVYKDWWKGSLRGQTGIFPLNYVEKLADPTAEELQKDAQMEAEVFGQIKNVEKLLALLSTSEGNSAVQDNDEITTLYHSTLQIRPKLIELIGKYSQKKDDFVALNEKFIKARRDYELLLESSMSGTAAAHYGRPPAVANPYAYPPSDAYGDPGRFYSNAPPHHGPPASPQNAGAYGPPQHQQPKPAHGGPGGPGGPPGGRAPYYQQPHDEQQQQPPQHHEEQQQPPHQQHQPPQGPSAPFYVVGQMPPAGHHPHGGRTNSVSPAPGGHQYPPPQNAPSAPPTNAYKAPDGHPAPQELATSVYDTPIESSHESSFNGRPTTPTAPTSYPAYGYQRPLATNKPSYPGAEGPSPVTPLNPYPQLQGSPQPPQGYQAAAVPPQSYHAYTAQRPPQGYYTGAPPSQAPPEPPASAGAGGSPPPQDYYRQSELFLPNGSRAQS